MDKCMSYCDKAKEIELCLECAEHYALQIVHNNWVEGEVK